MKTTTAAMNEWILRREINAYIKRRTCPFCGGPLSGRHPRAENGRILPMTYVCRQCGRNPREALADENHEPAGQSPEPEGEDAMKKSGRVHTIAKARTTPDLGRPKTETAPDAEQDQTIEGRSIPPGESAAETFADIPAGTDEATEPAAAPERERAGDGLVVFAFRLTKAERDEIHAAAGAAKASKFVRGIALAGARGDMKALQEAVDEIHTSVR